MNELSKSVDFLLDKAGPVIQYRLRKEILRDLSEAEEAAMLEKVYQMPHFKLVQSYVKESGYIGIGAHSGDRFHETYLQDGETAARLLAYYGVPRSHPMVANFVAAMRDEETLRREFTFTPAEEKRYNDRDFGLNNVSGLTALLLTMQSMLGWGDDDYVKPFQRISLAAFESLLPLLSVEEIVTRSGKNHTPYIDIDTHYPSVYHLAVLAYTRAWRTPETVKSLADCINHMDKILTGMPLGVKLHGKLTSYSLWKFVRPIRPFSADEFTNPILYRRILTELAMTGVGERADCIRKSAVNVSEGIAKDGILRFNFENTKQKRRCFPAMGNYPTAYVECALEDNYKTDTAIDCEMTFWAVQFLHLINQTEGK